MNLGLYVNGEQVDSASAVEAKESDGPLGIGCAETFGEYFDGKIDEVRVYDRALDGGELEDSQLSLPAVDTTEAYGVHPTEAVLVGTVDPHNTEPMYYFEYGTTSAYGNKVPEVTEDVVTGDEVREVEEAIDDLQSKTTYHYRIVATDSAGTVVGQDKTLTTGIATSAPLQLEEQRDVLLNETRPSA